MNPVQHRGARRRTGRCAKLSAMADGLVLDSPDLRARRARDGSTRRSCRSRHARSDHSCQSVGYEEWERSGFVRREMARHGVALILGVGDNHGGVRGRGRQPRTHLWSVRRREPGPVEPHRHRGHRLGAQVELTPAGALALFGNVADLNDAVVPLDEALGTRRTQLLERLGDGIVLGRPVRCHRRGPRHGRSAPAGRRGGVAPSPAGVLERPGPRRTADGRDGPEPTARHRPLPPPAGGTAQGYARLLRFEHASSLLTDQPARRSLAPVAGEAGYYDQSHLNREFASLAGMTPAAFIAGSERVPEVRFVQDEPVDGPSEWTHEQR